MAGEQRRLAAVLAADVVGYSRLVGRDESGTVARLRELRQRHLEPVLGRHSGRLVKLTGDGALAEFPSAVGAVTAAIEFQQAVAGASKGEPADNTIRFRIGIHLGDLIVDGDDLHGDAVNVAARLEAEAPPGGILISRTVHEAVAGRLKATFPDRGDLALKNIERLIRAFEVKWQAGDWPGRDAATRHELATGSVPSHVPDEALALPDKPSIAVLPFTNMSGDPEQEYFTDGVTEDIITELSRFRSLFVIARNSSFSYKGTSPDTRRVGRELGVRYVLEGSIRRAGNRIRVAAQLIDSLSGSHIWAERYDRVLEEIFAVQEEVTRAIVAAITPQIETAEIARSVRVRPANLGAYELAHRAWAEARDAFLKSDVSLRDRAIETARQALAIDPDCGLALVSTSFAHIQHFISGTAADRDAARAQGLAASTRAIEIDASNHVAYALRGLLYYYSGQRRMGVDDLRHAHWENPNDATTLQSLGLVEAMFGDAVKGVECSTMALRLSPRDYFRASMLQVLALSHFLARQYEQGMQAALAATREAPGFPQAWLTLALNLTGSGNIDQALAAVEVVRRIAPALLDIRLAEGYPFERHEDRERAMTFLRVAASLEDPGTAGLH